MEEGVKLATHIHLVSRLRMSGQYLSSPRMSQYREQGQICPYHGVSAMCVCVCMGTAVAQWLRCCATNRKVASSIPASVSGFFIDIKSFRSHYGPGVDSASNRNEYQEYLLG